MRKDFVDNQMKSLKVNSTKEGTDIYPVSMAHSGVVLYRESGRDIVKLSSRNFAPHQGGYVKLDYLYNGITGRRHNVELDLQRDGDTWLVTYQGRIVQKMHFVKNKKRFVGVVGVKRIEFN